jgi:hypothetical protein
MEAPVNRVVTGFDADGRPAVIAEGMPPTIIYAGRYTTTELWVSGRGPITPVSTDTSTQDWALEPPSGGACFRIVEIAPADDAAPDDAPANEAAAGPGGGPDEHAEFQGAHATGTLDYVTILRGEVTLVVGDREIVLRPGDSVVQQPGVPHDWQNRSDVPAVMAGVLLSAG